MINFNRTEDKQAMVGTTVFYILLILLLFILSKSCTNAEAKDEEAGGVAISLGEPDQGGPDNSSAQEESTPPASVPEYTPQSQLTSDDAEAPEVQKTKPEPKVKPKTTPTESKPITEPTTKPTEAKPTKSAPKINIGKDKTGKGSGDDSRSGGYKGRPDGTPDGDPNGTGGKGKSGTGTGSGPTSGPVVGLIGGFDAKITPPSGGIQDNGVVRLYVCVNENGTVTTVKHEPLRGAPGTTTNSGLVNKAIGSIKQSSFKNVSGSEGGCGYFTYTFKVN
jgi:outer membrane biosynthesis protein TonB